MTIRTDFYQITLRFPRLFPDPILFEDPVHLSNRYLQANGLSREQSDLICQSTEEILPVDDRGNPSSTSGTAKFPFERRMILAEYMSNANVRLDYTDFGTALAPSDHSRRFRTVQDAEGAWFGQYPLDDRTGRYSRASVQSSSNIH